MLDSSIVSKQTACFDNNNCNNQEKEKFGTKMMVCSFTQTESQPSKQGSWLPIVKTKNSFFV